MSTTMRIGGATQDSTGDEEWRTRAVILRGQRQALLAGNLANADTPGYLARDVDFAAALRQAGVPANPLLATTSSRHLGSSLTAQRSTFELAQYSLPAQDALDGNTVDMDVQRAGIAKNSILFQFSMLVAEDEAKESQMAGADKCRDCVSAGLAK